MNKPRRSLSHRAVAWTDVRALLVTTLVLAGTACVGPEPYYRTGDNGTGGATGAGSGGTTGGGTGGATTTGTGGTATTGSGGAVATGTGGTKATGSGGATGTGSGGATATGTGGTTTTTGSGGAGVTCVGTCFMEDFEDGDLTKPQSWISPSDDTGMWSTTTDGTKVLQGTGVSESQSVSGNGAWRDQAIEARFKLIGSTSDSFRISLYGRYTDPKTNYMLQMESAQVKIRRRVNGSTTDLAKLKLPSGTTVAPGAWHTIKLVIAGQNPTTITGFFDGMETTPSDGSAAGPVTDTAPVLVGGIGVGVQACTVSFDDVTVSAP